MNMLKDKIKEISELMKLERYSGDYKDYIEEVLNIASSNYFEDDLENLIYKYRIRGYIFENHINYKNKKLMLPVKGDILQNKCFDYKVFMILKLLANNKQNNIITKFMLQFNKAKIFEGYNISEKDFLKGFNELISLGILKDEETHYRIDLKKNEGYYLLLDRNICKTLVKEGSRAIKTYIFMRDFLKYENDLSENSKGIINYGIINSGTGYTDTKSLKNIIDKLIELDLIERTENKDGYKTTYTYEIIKATLIDYLPE